VRRYGAPMRRESFAAASAPSEVRTGSAGQQGKNHRPEPRKIILVGNPNVGKSVIFKNLTGGMNNKPVMGAVADKVGYKGIRLHKA